MWSVTPETIKKWKMIFCIGLEGEGYSREEVIEIGEKEFPNVKTIEDLKPLIEKYKKH